jgi:glutamine synthetase
LLKEIVTNHKRIIFNGNNYSDDWVEEAKREDSRISAQRCRNPALIADKNVEVLGKHGDLSKIEIESRYEITLKAI